MTITLMFPNKIPLCFYHSADLDGKCSAAVVNYYYVKNISGDYRKPVNFFPINYGDKFPWDLVNNHDVFMVDFSLQPYLDMIKLNKVSNLIWIDHHETAIEENLKNGELIKGLCKVGYSGCELTWKFLFPSDDIPLSISLLGRYDVWDMGSNFCWETIILPFQYGIRTYNTSPSNDILWNSILEDDSLVFDCVNTGNFIISYQNKENKLCLDQISFSLEWEGLKCCV